VNHSPQGSPPPACGERTVPARACSCQIRLGSNSVS
jgi:hypothetical protein